MAGPKLATGSGGGHDVLDDRTFLADDDGNGDYIQNGLMDAEYYLVEAAPDRTKPGVLRVINEGLRRVSQRRLFSPVLGRVAAYHTPQSALN